MSEKYPNHRWKHDDQWKTHSLACWEKEWVTYKEIAKLVGAKSTNAWIRDSLNQCVLYEKMNLEEKARQDGPANSADSGSFQ